jgi:ketosteroid isomerase-like protein
LPGVPSERVDIASRGFEAFNRGEFDALGEVLHDDDVAVVPDSMANSGVLAPTIQYGRGRGSGVEISMRTVFLLRFRGDRVAFYSLCENLEEAREHARDI